MSHNDLYKADLLKQYKRIIVISDVHANYEACERLLQKAQFCNDDYLIFLGDIIQKGQHNIDGLKWFYNNFAESGNVCFLLGNHEYWLLDILRYRSFDDVLSCYNWPNKTLVSEWFDEMGIKEPHLNDADNFFDYVNLNYGVYLNWLSSFSLSLSTDDYIFVHSGLGQCGRLQESNAWDKLKNDFYILDGINHTGKWVVVGHMPTFNAVETLNSNNPVVFSERKIIAIDGGNMIKAYGQVNAFIISSKNEFSYVFCDDYDHYPVTTVLADYTPCGHSVTFKTSYLDAELVVLESGEYFSRVQKIINGEIGFLKNEKLDYKNDKVFCYSSVGNLLCLKHGEMVTILDDTLTGFCLVKNGFGRIGYAPHNYLSRFSN